MPLIIIVWISGKRGALQYANQISQDLELPNSDGYKKKSLNSWKLAPVVPKNKGLPGEMGKVRLFLKSSFSEKATKIWKKYPTCSDAIE